MLMKSVKMVITSFGFVFSNVFNYFAAFELPKLKIAVIADGI